jgi:transposase-like protein
MTDMASLPERVDQDPETGIFLPGNKAACVYDPAICDSVRKLAKLGATIPEIADIIDVSPRTVSNWRVQHPEFAQALKLGGDEAMDRLETSLFARGVGYDYTEETAIKLKTVRFEGGKKVAEVEEIEVVELRRHMPPDTFAATKVLVAKGRDEWRDKRDVNFNGKMTHYTPDEARAELARFYLEEGGNLIEGQAVEIEQ